MGYESAHGSRATEKDRRFRRPRSSKHPRPIKHCKHGSPWSQANGAVTPIQARCCNASLTRPKARIVTPLCGSKYTSLDTIHVDNALPDLGCDKLCQQIRVTLDPCASYNLPSLAYLRLCCLFCCLLQYFHVLVSSLQKVSSSRFTAGVLQAGSKKRPQAESVALPNGTGRRDCIAAIMSGFSFL